MNKSAAAIQIGYCPGGGNFNGKIDDVRIYRRALTDSEIKALYSLEY